MERLKSHGFCFLMFVVVVVVVVGIQLTTRLYLTEKVKISF